MTKEPRKQCDENGAATKVIAVRIEAVREVLEIRMDGFERLTNERFANIDKALVLQADANAKHFASLNGEASRLSTMQSTYIPREIADSRNDALQKQIGEQGIWQSNQEGRRIVWAIVVPLIVSTVAAIALMALQRLVGK